MQILQIPSKCVFFSSILIVSIPFKKISVPILSNNLKLIFIIIYKLLIDDSLLDLKKNLLPFT